MYVYILLHIFLSLKNFVTNGLQGGHANNRFSALLSRYVSTRECVKSRGASWLKCNAHVWTEKNICCCCTLLQRAGSQIYRNPWDVLTHFAHYLHARLARTCPVVPSRTYDGLRIIRKVDRVRVHTYTHAIQSRTKFHFLVEPYCRGVK